MTVSPSGESQTQRKLGCTVDWHRSTIRGQRGGKKQLAARKGKDSVAWARLTCSSSPRPCRCLFPASQSLLLAPNRCVPWAPIGREGGSSGDEGKGAVGPHIPAPTLPAKPRLNKNQGREAPVGPGWHGAWITKAQATGAAVDSSYFPNP